ncbi:MAG: hypothetical protein ACI93R_004001 [Flavobacteriales bacterium]|jgi:hypothetical protein
MKSSTEELSAETFVTFLIGLILLYGGYLAYVSFESNWKWVLIIPCALMVLSILKLFKEIILGEYEIKTFNGAVITLLEAPVADVRRWSHSELATTINYVLPREKPWRYLKDNQAMYDGEYLYGNRIEYTNAPSQHILCYTQIDEDSRYTYDAQQWQGELSDSETAVKLDIENFDRGDVFGISPSKSIIHYSYKYPNLKSIYILNHADNSLQTLVEQQTLASADIGWQHEFHYALTYGMSDGRAIVVYYAESKNYDDFFSARGRSLPKLSHLYIISDEYPAGKKLATIPLTKGLVIGVDKVNDQIVIETLDERILEEPISRFYVLAEY